MNQKENWKTEAIRCFFDKKLNIQEISDVLKISRKSVAKHLKDQPGYVAEKEQRKINNAKKRKEYKRNWDRDNRPSRYSLVSGDTMRREHELAVSILSHEKY